MVNNLGSDKNRTVTSLVIASPFLITVLMIRHDYHGYNTLRQKVQYL